MGSHRDSLFAAAVLFLVLDSTVVFARVYVRTRVVIRGFGWDDFVLCLTYIGFVISLGLGFAAMQYGYAAEDEQPWYDKKKATMFTYGNQTTLYISAGLVKLAVALVLLRITVGKGIRFLLIGSMFVVGVWTIITVVFASFICAKGGSSNWAGSERCTQVGYFRTISNIFIDYFYALLPIYILRGSQLKTRLKLIAMFLLGLGIFASTATIVKLVIIVRLPNATGKEADGLHYDLLLWADIELGLAILAASAAALRPLLRHIPTLFDTTSKSATRDTDESGPYHELVVNSRDINKNKVADSEAGLGPGPKVHESATGGAASSDEELFRIR
ncbi:putative integral membrane protein [Rosellinia necatrix]|uniref:Putative integral membrane protein n=1 Tax=Rosellinia necatrix TaxID=77044 RepID=A0A1W2TBA3_ROSNE|nr:putative integral membrane protein [Rosellinia necatrix]